jgi:hypothetical protein
VKPCRELKRFNSEIDVKTKEKALYVAKFLHETDNLRVDMSVLFDRRRVRTTRRRHARDAESMICRKKTLLCTVSGDYVIIGNRKMFNIKCNKNNYICTSKER